MIALSNFVEVQPDYSLFSWPTLIIAVVVLLFFLVACYLILKKTGFFLGFSLFMSFFGLVLFLLKIAENNISSDTWLKISNNEYFVTVLAGFSPYLNFFYKFHQMILGMITKMFSLETSSFIYQDWFYFVPYLIVFFIVLFIKVVMHPKTYVTETKN